MNKKTFLYVVIIIIYLFFQSKLLDGYNKLIILPHLKEITPSVTVFILLWVIIGLTGYQLIYLGRIKQQISFPLLFSAIFIFCIYGYHRFFTERYEYYYSTFAPCLKYADVTLFITGGIILLSIIERILANGKPVFKNKAFLVDAPINKVADDKFDRTDFARSLADKIQSDLTKANSGALAIGINGSWGSGKTSFANLIKAEFDLKNRIVIDFNPWRSLTPSKIIEDFFEVISEELKKYDAELSADISAYAKTLTEIDDNVVTKGIKSFSELLFGSKSKQEYYDDINASIAKIEKQIIIFIDDLDRLDTKEIVEVLRLIRNTANFNKLVYVVSYDRNYVLEAIKTFNQNDHVLFLEKIFQFEFSLPDLNPNVIRESIKVGLNQGLDVGKQATVQNAIGFLGNSGRNLTNKIIRTQRDVVRFCNSFLFEVGKVENEVNLIDFYFLQLIKLKYSNLYQQVAKYKNVFFINEKSRMRLRKTSERNSEISSFDELWNRMHPRPQQEEQQDKPILYEYIRTNMKTDFDSDVLIEIFEALLTEKDFRMASESRDYKSFVNYANFESYFSITHDASNLSAVEFESTRLGDYNNYQNKVDQWLADGREQIVLDKLQSIIDFETQNEWENHLKILIHIGKTIEKVNHYGVDYRQIVDVIGYPKNRDDTFKFFADEAAYHNYFRDFFDTAPEPYIFESQLLNNGLTGILKFPLTRVEIEEQLFKYFNNYCNAHAEITNDFRALYPFIVMYHNVLNVPYPIQPRAIQLFKDHFKTNLKVEHLASFISQYDISSSYYHLDIGWIQTFFNSANDFISFIDHSPNIDRQSEIYLEFKRFYGALVASNRAAIEFDFHHLTRITFHG